MKFKVGDRVKFVKNFLEHTGVVELGKVYKIIKTDGSFAPYKVENGEWFTTAEIELAEYTYEDLKKSPIGTKIIFKDGEVLVKDEEDKFESSNDWIHIDCLKDLASYKFGKIIKIEEPAYTTVYEAKVEILDEAEKRYLRDVIRPFRDRVRSIEKFIFSTGRAKIGITVKNDDSYWYINLPPFEKDTMYKNMEEDKEYTLEELGL